MHDGPRKAVSKRKISPFMLAIHVILTICTGGLWGIFVWWPASRRRRTVTTFK